VRQRSMADITFSFPALFGLLARLGQQVERAFDAGDHAGGDTRVTRRRLQFAVTEQRQDNSDIGASEEHEPSAFDIVVSKTAQQDLTAALGQHGAQPLAAIDTRFLSAFPLTRTPT
jgi:hypothetical protein